MTKGPGDEFSHSYLCSLGNYGFDRDIKVWTKLFPNRHDFNIKTDMDMKIR